MDTSPSNRAAPVVAGEVTTGGDATSTNNKQGDPKKVRFNAVIDVEEDDYNDVPTYPPRPSYRNFHSGLSWDTQLVHFDGCPDDPYRPCSVPIYMTSTFEQPSSTEFGPYDYSRSGNPTRTALERQVAMMENAFAAFAFSSGMAALGAVVRSQCCAGDTVLLSDDIYGGMHRLCSRICTLHGIKVRLVNTSDLVAVRDVLEEDDTITLLHFESPTNPMLHISDIGGIADIVNTINDKRGTEGDVRKIIVSVDSTMMTPYLQNPINHGADIVVHSATKFLGGTSDVMGGFVCVANPSLAKIIAFFQNAEGSALSPFDSWLFLRGIKTLALRVKTAQASAVRIAEYLRTHNIPTSVNFTSLVDPVHWKQARGAGCVISFTTGSVDVSRIIIDNLNLFKLTVSFGSVTSLAEMPATLSHASIPAHERTIPDDLIRLSIGIEDTEDLLADLMAALAATESPTSPTAIDNSSPSSGDDVDLSKATLTNVQRVRGGAVEKDTAFKISARTPSTMHTTDRPSPQPPAPRRQSATEPISGPVPTGQQKQQPAAVQKEEGVSLTTTVATVATLACCGGFVGGLLAGIALSRRLNNNH